MQPDTIILNGTSSSGKSSIAKAIQRISKRPIVHLSLDTFTNMFDWPSIQVSDRRECHRIAVSNFHAALAVLIKGPYTVVVDHVFEQMEWYRECQKILADKRAIWAGVRCPIEVLEAREIARGDRRIGLARFQFPRVHEGKRYDLEVDTSRLSSDGVAKLLLDFLSRNLGKNEGLKQ